MTQDTETAPPPEEVEASDPMRGWDAETAEAAGLMRLSKRPPMRLYFQQLWERREFIYLTPLGDLRQQHMNTVFGGLWHLFNPLLMAGVYYFVFGVLLGARRGIDNYAVYLVAGLMVYRYTQKCVQSGARTIVSNEKLLHNIQFPAASLPLSTLINETVAQVPAVFVIWFFALATGETMTLAWLILIPVTMVQAVFNLGLAFFTARITVHFRDTQEILTYILRLGFYLSGVIIGIEAVPDDMPVAKQIYALNPVYNFIIMTRRAIFDGVFDTRAMMVSAAWTVVLVVTGFIFFWRFEGKYANAA